MKKIVFILTFAFLSTFSYSQVAMTNPNRLTIDTASQAAAEGPSLQVKQYQAAFSSTLNLTKISGTIAGNVKWQGSNDGVVWFTLQTDTLTDASAVWGYSEAPKKWLYYKALITQTGTSSLSYKATTYYSKPN